MKITNLAFLYLLSITVDTTIATNSHRQHHVINNNVASNNYNVLLSNKSNTPKLRSTTARLLQNNKKKKKKNSPLKNKPIINESPSSPLPVNPCSVCSTGLTVPSNTTAASNGNTCADLLIDAAKEEEGSETCANMAGAIPTCCPPLVVVEEVVQQKEVVEPAEEPEYTVVLSPSAGTSSSPTLSPNITPPTSTAPTPSPVLPCSELNKKRCQKAMDESGRCIFIKGASDTEDSCIDPPPSSSPILSPTTDAPTTSPIDPIVEIEKGDVVLIDNTTLTIEEEHLDMLLAPSGEEQEATVEPLPAVVEETEDPDFTVEVIPVFLEDTETDDGINDDNLDSEVAIQALEKAPATAYPTFYPTLSPVSQPVLEQNSLEINEAAYEVAGKASKGPHGRYSSSSSSSYDHHSGGYGGKSSKPHGKHSSSSSSSYDHSGKSGKSGRHSYSSSSSDGWGKPYYSYLETQSRSGKALKDSGSSTTLNVSGLTVSSQQLAVEDVVDSAVTVEEIVVETAPAIVTDVVNTPSLTAEEIMAQSLTAQYEVMMAEQQEEEVETPAFFFNPPIPENVIAPPGELAPLAEVAVPEGYKEYVGAVQDVVGTAAASQSSNNPMVDLITAAQDAIQKAINTVHEDKDALKQAKKDAEEKYKAAMEELKKQQKLQLAALDEAQIATPPTQPNFSEMTISEIQANGINVSDMTIEEASFAVKGTNQKKKNKPGRKGEKKQPKGGKSRKLRYRQ